MFDFYEIFCISFCFCLVFFHHRDKTKTAEFMFFGTKLPQIRNLQTKCKHRFLMFSSGICIFVPKNRRYEKDSCSFGDGVAAVCVQ